MIRFHFLNDVANDAELTQKSLNYVLNSIPGSRLLISSLPGSALRMVVELLSKPRDVTKPSQKLTGKLDIKRNSPCILCLLAKSSPILNWK